MRVLKLLPVVVLLILSSCIRFVEPHQASTNPDIADGGLTAGAKAVSKEEFFAFEEASEERLGELIQQRSGMLDVADSSDRLVGPGDLLQFEVFGFPDLSQELEVSDSGQVEFPLVGTMNANNVSSARLRARVKSALKKYIVRPQVSLTVLEHNARTVAISGAVEKPGIYPLKRAGQLLTDVISEAGGLTDKAGNVAVLIPANSVTRKVRSGNGSQRAIRTAVELNLDDMFGDVTKDPQLVPLVAGDRILIPNVGEVQVDGEVQKPGSYDLATKTSTLGAIAAAGGFTYSADYTKVEVIRELDRGEKAIVVVNLADVVNNTSADIRLRDGDVVRVPSSSGRFYARQIGEIFDSLFSVGMRPN